MTEHDQPVDNSVIVGQLVEATQRIEAAGAVTHTRSRVLRAPWWVVALVVGLPSPHELVAQLVSLLE